MTRKKLAAGVAVLLALAAACSPASVGAPSSSTDYATACAEKAAAYCAHLESDCSATALEIRYGSVSLCRAVMAARCLGSANAPSGGDTLALIQACTTALESPTGWPCNDFVFSQNPPPACATPAGALANGAPCGDPTQCQSAYCALAPGAACGTCAPQPSLGSSCTQVGCGANQVCTAGVCTVYSGVGASCSTSSQPCAEGLTCTGGTCQAGAGQGMPCSTLGAGCDLYQGLACNASTGMCDTIHLANPGEGCGTVGDEADSCLDGECVRGVCVQNGSFGAPCTVDGSLPCNSALKCVTSGADGGLGTCQVLVETCH